MSSRGFSLIELLLGLFVLAVVVGLLSTTIAGYRQQAARKTVESQITADLDVARAYAKTKYANVDILFADTTYSILQGTTVVKEMSLAKSWSTSNQRFGFTPQGSSRFAGTLLLYCNNRQQAKLTIAVGSGLPQWKKS